MASFQGRLLVARPELADPNFTRTVISLLAHDEDGAFGVVLNRPADSLALGDGPPDLDAALGLEVDDGLHVGGPVDPTALVVLGETDDGRPAALGAEDGESAPMTGRVRLYAGYAGWGPGQLEAEIEEGSWVLCDPAPGDHLAADSERLWHVVLVRQELPTRLLAWFPRDLSLN